MTTTEEPSVRELVRGDSRLAAGDVALLRDAINGPRVFEVRTELDALVAGSSALSEEDRLRAGITAYLLAATPRAVELLSASDSPVASFYLGRTLLAAERPAEAEQALAAARDGGYEPVLSELLRAGAVRRLGDLEEAEKIIRGVARRAAGLAEYSYQMGCLLADRADPYGAIEYFERAADMDPYHGPALMRLAAEHASRGEERDAIRLYEQALSRPPFTVGAMLNLGLLYEDVEEYRAAAYCFSRVLQSDPTHQRAKLYLKDIEATDGMYYDEESAREAARLDQLLERPIADFELSVRSRNCLQAMDLTTLGDLTKVTEQELLDGKNFGETSLKEIQDIMHQHGLKVGQDLDADRTTAEPVKPSELSPQEQMLLSRPIADLDLTVRARKCMTRLGITTFGDIVRKTPDELLSTRNFGVTSLNEIRAKLSEFGLNLRND
ncbi:MAG: DNA-directed RNA polymerase subunit alpha C-terminal domain-containing protein [Planctomycetota bacterium]